MGSNPSSQRGPPNGDQQLNVKKHSGPGSRFKSVASRTITDNEARNERFGETTTMGKSENAANPLSARHRNSCNNNTLNHTVESYHRQSLTQPLPELPLPQVYHHHYNRQHRGDNEQTLFQNNSGNVANNSLLSQKPVSEFGSFMDSPETTASFHVGTRRESDVASQGPEMPLVLSSAPDESPLIGTQSGTDGSASDQSCSFGSELMPSGGDPSDTAAVL